MLNANGTEWFVWNSATYDLRDAINASIVEWAADEDEFAKAGVTPIECVVVPCPRVKESLEHFECRYLSTHRLKGHSNHGWVDVNYGEVIRIHVSDEVIMPNGKMDITRIRLLARLGYYDYTSVTDVFEMRIPSATDAAAAGLEGKASEDD